MLYKAVLCTARHQGLGPLEGGWHIPPPLREAYDIDEGIGQTGRIREFLGQGVERVYVPQRLCRCTKHPQRHGHIAPCGYPEVETMVCGQSTVVGWDIQGDTLREVSMRCDHLPTGKQHYAERRVCHQEGERIALPLHLREQVHRHLLCSLQFRPL